MWNRLLQRTEAWPGVVRYPARVVLLPLRYGAFVNVSLFLAFAGTGVLLVWLYQERLLPADESGIAIVAGMIALAALAPWLASAVIVTSELASPQLVQEGGAIRELRGLLVLPIPVASVKTGVADLVDWRDRTAAEDLRKRRRARHKMWIFGPAEPLVYVLVGGAGIVLLVNLWHVLDAWMPIDSAIGVAILFSGSAVVGLVVLALTQVLLTRWMLWVLTRRRDRAFALRYLLEGEDLSRSRKLGLYGITADELEMLGRERDSRTG